MSVSIGPNVTLMSRHTSGISVLWGVLANGNLRHKRILAHKALEDYRVLTHMEKWAVYIWLQGKLGLNEHQIHIAKFSEEMCDQVIALCEEACATYQTNHKTR